MQHSGGRSDGEEGERCGELCGDEEELVEKRMRAGEEWDSFLSATAVAAVVGWWHLGRWKLLPRCRFVVSLVRSETEIILRTAEA